MSKTIGIILSTYNGSSFLAEQIQSIIEQTYINWILYIRDDGSTDSTREIIKQYAEKDSRIKLIDDTENIGIKKSFLKVLKLITTDYYMFCDQDDLWDKNKIKIMLNAIEKVDINIPSIATCDLRLIDDKNYIMHKSMRKSHKIVKLSHRSWGLLVAPMFPGCSMMFNNKAKQIALNEIYDFPLHDMLLSYSVFKNRGEIIPIDEVLMGYRQHSNNAVGAKIGKNYWIGKLNNITKVLNQNKSHFTLIHNYLGINIFQFIFLKIKHTIID